MPGRSRGGEGGRSIKEASSCSHTKEATPTPTHTNIFPPHPCNLLISCSVRTVVGTCHTWLPSYNLPVFSLDGVILADALPPLLSTLNDQGSSRVETGAFSLLTTASTSCTFGAAVNAAPSLPLGRYGQIGDIACLTNWCSTRQARGLTKLAIISGHFFE